ncbi:MAG: UDP-3-O-(3-hydroxymyristoyl)glucosamine N-acyltransferase [Burkholderiaceae bacterium]
MRPLDEALKLGDVATLIGARLVRGDPALGIRTLASLAAAGPDALSFVVSARYAAQAAQTRAGAVIVPTGQAGALPPDCAALEVDDPHRAFALVARHVEALLQRPAALGIDGRAIVSPDAQIGAGASIGAFTIVEAGAQIGDEVRIGAGCFIGAGSSIGKGTRIDARVTIEHDCRIGERCRIYSGTVIGADGFGYADTAGGWERVPQLGSVVIGNDVDIGANCTIDRGALEDTVIGDGCKLDNLIQIAHNVRIGEHTAMAACSGIAGSAVIGRRCRIGGSAGIVGHIEICDDVVVGGMTMITRSIKRPGFYTAAFPMMENADWEKAAAVVRQLPQWRQRWRRLERALDADGSGAGKTDHRIEE